MWICTLKFNVLHLVKNSILCLAILAFTSCSLVEMDNDEANNTLEPPEETHSIHYINNAEMENELLDLTNAYRVSIGKEEVALNSLANTQAALHNVYMIEKNQISHDNFIERTRYFLENGFTYVKENVGSGQITAEELFNAWLQSETHRENVESNYYNTGISILKNDQGVYFFTQIYLN